jgi:RHS repeat-associated protein
MTKGSDTLYFTYGALGPTTVTWNGTTYYYALNAQGDVIGIFDGGGNGVVLYNWDNAWGYHPQPEGPMADTLGTLNPLRYRSYVYDEETGLYYVSSRYYSPEICRFINADDVDLLGANDDFASLNLFVYCGNNPVSREDPNGGFWVTVGVMAVGGLIGAAISAVSSAVTQKALTGTVNWKSVGVAAASGFVSGAVAASPLGIVGQQIAGGVIGGLSYAADCYVNDKAMKLDEAILSVGMGVVSGRIGGSGANEKMVLSNAAKSAKQTIARESRRANQQYAQKVIAATISSRNNTFASTA